MSEKSTIFLSLFFSLKSAIYFFVRSTIALIFGFSFSSSSKSLFLSKQYSSESFDIAFLYESLSPLAFSFNSSLPPFTDFSLPKLTLFSLSDNSNISPAFFILPMLDCSSKTLSRYCTGPSSSLQISIISSISDKIESILLIISLKIYCCHSSPFSFSEFSHSSGHGLLIAKRYSFSINSDMLLSPLVFAKASESSIKSSLPNSYSLSKSSSIVSALKSDISLSSATLNAGSISNLSIFSFNIERQKLSVVIIFADERSIDCSLSLLNSLELLSCFSISFKRAL